jgi:ATP-dependent Clp protease ATP-binding subunit ClpC
VFDRFNGAARRAMLLAFRQARRCQHDFLGTEHVLFGLLCDSAGPAAHLLRALGTPPETLLGQIQELMLDDETTTALERFPLSPAVRRAFERAAEEAQQLGQQLVGPEHLLLGLLHEAGSEAAVILGGCGITLALARQKLLEISPAEKHDHLLQPEAAALAIQPAESDPSATALETYVAPSVVVERSKQTADANGLAVDDAAPPPAGLPQQLRAAESQLRMTQLALGTLLGFCLGIAIDDLKHALLYAMGGFAVAVFRSSFVGACAGAIGGLWLPSITGRDFGDERTHAGRIILAVLGALLGSLLGDFWRLPLARLISPPPRAEPSQPRNAPQ